MESRRQHRKYKKSRGPLLAVAIGLVLVSAALLLWPRPAADSAANAASGAGMAVVPVEVDFAAPELSLNNIQGERESLVNYQGQVVLVNNWAIWCPPCKAEMPTLEAYYEQHSAEDFTIVAVEAGDKGEDVVPFVQSYKLQFNIWIDPAHASLRAFNNSNLPNSYVIDRRGRVRYAWTGEITQPMLEKYITPLLSE